MKQIIVWLSLCLSLSVTAGTDSLLEYALKDLNTGRSEALQKFQGKPVIMSFLNQNVPGALSNCRIWNRCSRTASR